MRMMRNLNIDLPNFDPNFNSKIRFLLPEDEKFNNARVFDFKLTYFISFISLI